HTHALSIFKIIPILHFPLWATAPPPHTHTHTHTQMHTYRTSHLTIDPYSRSPIVLEKHTGVGYMCEHLSSSPGLINDSPSTLTGEIWRSCWLIRLSRG